MKKKILIFTILAIILPLSFSSCDDDRWEDDLIGDYYCEANTNFIRLRADGRGFIEDDFDRYDTFVWWAGKYTITFAYVGGPTVTYDYRFTHDGLYINDDFYLYADNMFYAKKKAAKQSAEKKVEQKAETEK